MAAALAQRPAAGMMPAERQVATAVQFTLRIAFPLAGERVPELRGPLDVAGLRGAARRRRGSICAGSTRRPSSGRRRGW